MVMQGLLDHIQLYGTMIVLVSLGTGFFKGNLQAVVGQIFEGDQKRKDDAFSTMYSFINIGSFIGTTFVGGFICKTCNSEC